MITLPRLPYGSQTTPSLNSKSTVLTPSIGAGPQQRLVRPGDRYTWQINTQTMSVTQGMAFVSGLLQGLSNKVRLYLYPGILTGGQPGATTAGQAGTSINAFSCPANYYYGQGRWFSLEHAGVYYLHMLTAPAQADSSGNTTFNFWPALRVQTAQSDLLHFDNPAIEGFVDGQSQGWTQNLAQTIGLSFSITEST